MKRKEEGGGMEGEEKENVREMTKSLMKKSKEATWR